MWETLFTDQSEGARDPEIGSRRTWQWLNLSLTAVLILAALWYLRSRISLIEVSRALSLAKVEFIALSLLFMLLTLVAKAWRWRVMLITENDRISTGALFWSILLGQYANLLLPVLRLGELARVYALYRHSGISKVQSLGTLVVEKLLDLMILGATTAVILSTLVVPEFVSNSGLWVFAVALVVLAFSFLVAYKTDVVIRATRSIADKLPTALGTRVIRISISGLEGLAVLRSHRASLTLVVLSLAIVTLSILTPWALFPAFGIPLGFVEATLLNVVVTLALVPPSTPGKLVVFDGAAAFVLVRLGLTDEGTIAGYTIVYHLVILLPQLLLGSMASSRMNWHWRRIWHV